jgi:hypothetical protein
LNATAAAAAAAAAAEETLVNAINKDITVLLAADAKHCQRGGGLCAHAQQAIHVIGYNICHDK